ncbi:hypothetical protein ACKVMT_05370 [Halobacteriales archaeon Cl-PHB]
MDRITASKSPDPQLPESADLPVTETIELLVPERRQAIIEELATRGCVPVSASTLAEIVACAEYECDAETLEADQRKRVYIALIQSHLPLLEQAEAVTYDTDSKLVDRGPEFERFWQTYVAILKSLS